MVMVMVVIVVMIVMSQIGDLVDDRPGAADQLILLPLVDRLVVEGSRVQERLDLGGQGVAPGRNVGDGGEEAGVTCVGAEDRPVRKRQAVASHRAKRRVELLIDL